MKRINYPDRKSNDFTDLLDDYKAIFNSNLSAMEKDWKAWKSANSVKNIPETVEELLVADTDVLSDVYDRFTKLKIPSKVKNPTTGKPVRSPEYLVLDKIFSYSRGYDGDIAKFFEDRAELLHISSCHYCELSYINVYTHKGDKKRHFDLDHFLPKSDCPIVGLSLFNFVPSCQVCNSRIKIAHVLGNGKKEFVKFNPSSENYSFDANVKIKLRMNSVPVVKFKNPDDYYISFKCKNGFRKAVNFFQLEERYNFHRIEAMRIMALKSKYPKSAIRKIASLLFKTESEVEEDIFHRRFLTKNDRCFAKMTRDLL